MLQLLNETRSIDLPPWLMLTGAAAVVVLLLAVLLWPQWRRRNDPLSRPPQISLAQERSVERDMRTLMHELSEMARKVGGALDVRAARLEELIRQADQRLARLNDVAGAAKESSPGESLQATAKPAPISPLQPPHTDNGDVVDPRHAQIYALQDEGLSPQQIAERLGRPDGEVELILALRPRGRAVV